jgi:triphosphoribosyl-dephospho-CoA synthase
MTCETSEAVSDYVSRILQLAILLEVSAYPKPGNVHRTADFAETRYEHFLASAVALSPHFRQVAYAGIQVFQKKLALKQIGVGRVIKNAVKDFKAWQRDKNTLLGSILLLCPMAAAAGLTMAGRKPFRINSYRHTLKSVVESTTPDDAVQVYDAMEIAQPGGLGKTPRFDVTDARSKKEILAQGTSLYEIFKISAPWDSISAEWVDNFHITFDIGYPYFKHVISEGRDINTATLHTFLRILSEVPDTLIVRKAGKQEAAWASSEAGKALNAGGLTSREGRNRLIRLDRKMHDADHKLNPGTTADITSAVLAVAILEGYRP